MCNNLHNTPARTMQSDWTYVQGAQEESRCCYPRRTTPTQQSEKSANPGPLTRSRMTCNRVVG